MCKVDDGDGKGGEFVMKIIVDKFDYAKLIRSCKDTQPDYTGECRCALAGICKGQDDLEDLCEINDSEDE